MASSYPLSQSVRPSRKPLDPYFTQSQPNHISMCYLQGVPVFRLHIYTKCANTNR